ncbi:MAG: hypothetical protein ACREK2_06700 [Gemmatimonadota bacterium]
MVIRRLRPLVMIWAALVALGCGEEDAGVDTSSRVREAGELALPPSAGAPRVTRDAAAPDTFHPDTVDEFEIVDLDSFPLVEPGLIGPDPSVDAVADSYRRHYAEALDSEGSAVRGRIDRQIQQEAERRTAQERGFRDWTAMIEALTPEQRAGLVNRLNQANIEMANELHGTADEQEPVGTDPAGR